jgi:hypothetical protein
MADLMAFSGWCRIGLAPWRRVCDAATEDEAWRLLPVLAPIAISRDLAVIPAGTDPNLRGASRPQALPLSGAIDKLPPIRAAMARMVRDHLGGRPCGDVTDADIAALRSRGLDGRHIQRALDDLAAGLVDDDRDGAPEQPAARSA